jgi:hypothetical protein
MSVTTVLTEVNNDVKGFFGKLAADFQKAKQIWTLIASPQTRALLIKVGSDAIKFVDDAETAVENKGLNFQLDEATYNDIKTLIADAKAGDGILIADLQVLGITL